MSGRKYDRRARHTRAIARSVERLARLPGVAAVGGVSALPLSQMFAWGPITVEGRTPPAGEKFINADMRMVAGDYFRAMEIPLLEGRLFDRARHLRSKPRVTIIDRTHGAAAVAGRERARQTGASRAAVRHPPWTTVVGVVGRVKQYTLDTDSRIAMYLPHTQFPTRAMNIVVKSRTTAESLAAAGACRDARQSMPICRFTTCGPMAAARRRVIGAAPLLDAAADAVCGVGARTGGDRHYGVMAYLVSQGTRELGIRIALGATPSRILWMVVGQGMFVATVGAIAGVAGAFAMTRLVRTLLFGVESTDPVTFASVIALLAAVALVASGLPARRAARVDPVAVLERGMT